MVTSITQLLWTHLIQATWLALFIYWWFGAGRLKAVERRESRVQRASHSVPMLLAALLFILPGRDLSVLAAAFMERTWTSYSIGVVLVVLGCSFAILARRRLGSNWSAAVTLKHDHSLVQSGPYRHIRHPIYTGLVLAFAGTALALGEWRGLLALLMVCVSLVFKLRREERWMLEHFGTAYTDYRRGSWALLPWIY